MATVVDPGRIRDALATLRPRGGAADLLRVREELEALGRDVSASVAQLLVLAERELESTFAQTQAELLTVCQIEDLVGQRLAKALHLLTEVGDRLMRLADDTGIADATVEASAWETRRDTKLVNGPALFGPEVSQAEIDALFD